VRVKTIDSSLERAAAILSHRDAAARATFVPALPRSSSKIGAAPSSIVGWAHAVSAAHTRFMTSCIARLRFLYKRTAVFIVCVHREVRRTGTATVRP